MRISDDEGESAKKKVVRNSDIEVNHEFLFRVFFKDYEIESAKRLQKAD